MTLTVEERRPNVSCEEQEEVVLGVVVRGASCEHTHCRRDRKWRRSTGTIVASPQTPSAGQ